MITNKDLSLHTSVKQRPGNIVSDMDGEKVMLCINKGKYYNLGEIGGAIWDLIEQPVSIDELVNKLLVQYDVSREQCENHVLSFLSTLAEEQLIIIE